MAIKLDGPSVRLDGPNQAIPPASGPKLDSQQHTFLGGIDDRARAAGQRVLSEGNPLAPTGANAWQPAKIGGQAIDAVLGAPERAVAGGITGAHDGGLIGGVKGAIGNVFHPSQNADTTHHLEDIEHIPRATGTSGLDTARNAATDFGVETVHDPLTYIPGADLAERSALGLAKGVGRLADSAERAVPAIGSVRRAATDAVKPAGEAVRNAVMPRPELDDILHKQGRAVVEGSERHRDFNVSHDSQQILIPGRKSLEANVETPDFKAYAVANPAFRASVTRQMRGSGKTGQAASVNLFQAGENALRDVHNEQHVDRVKGLLGQTKPGAKFVKDQAGLDQHLASKPPASNPNAWAKASQKVSDLTTKAMFENPIPHVVGNVLPGAYMTGGLRGTVKGVGRGVQAMFDKSGSIGHEAAKYGAAPAFGTNEATSHLGRILGKPQEKLEQFETGLRESLMETAKKEIPGYAQLERDHPEIAKYQLGQYVQRHAGEYGASTGATRFFKDQLGGQFPGYHAYGAPAAVARGVAHNPGRVERLARAQSDVNQNEPGDRSFVSGGMIQNAGKTLDPLPGSAGYHPGTLEEIESVPMLKSAASASNTGPLSNLVLGEIGAQRFIDNRGKPLTGNEKAIEYANPLLNLVKSFAPGPLQPALDYGTDKLNERLTGKPAYGDNTPDWIKAIASSLGVYDVKKPVQPKPKTLDF